MSYLKGNNSHVVYVLAEEQLCHLVKSMNTQLTDVVLYSVGNRLRDFGIKYPKQGHKSTYFISMLSSIFTFYEYSMNKTRISGKNVHRNVHAKAGGKYR